jgi:hypothetical protein
MSIISSAMRVRPSRLVTGPQNLSLNLAQLHQTLAPQGNVVDTHIMPVLQSGLHVPTIRITTRPHNQDYMSPQSGAIIAMDF